MAGQPRRMAGTTDDNGSTKLDEHRSRVPGATNIGSTFHSEETLVFVHAVTLDPGAWPRTITNNRYKVQPSRTSHHLHVRFI